MKPVAQALNIMQSEKHMFLCCLIHTVTILREKLIAKSADLFIRLNTPLPASAAVERLFSCAGMIMNDRRTRLSDKNFENLVFLKVNSWMETKQNEVLSC